MMITITALFTKNTGEPATGLALADIDIYLYRRVKATGVVSTVWTAQNPTQEIGGGLYCRSYTGDDTATYEYFGHAQYTGVTVLDSNYALQIGTFLDDQSVRDAMKLAPTAGTPAAGSVDEHLDDIQAKTDLMDTASITVASGISGSELTFYVGATFSETVSGLTIPSDWTKVLFTLKEEDSDAESAALLQVQASNPGVVADGLIRLNGAILGTGEDAWAALTVTQAAGTVAVKVHQSATAALLPRRCRWDMKVLTSDSPVEGTLLVAPSDARVKYPVTRSTA